MIVWSPAMHQAKRRLQSVELLEARRLLSSVTGIGLPPTPGTGGTAPSSYSASSLTVGPDGAIWFTDQDNNAVGREAADGSIAEYPLPTDSAGPDRITRGPDGNLWFVETDAAQIGRITPAGSVREFSIPNPDSDPTDITAGPGGSLWFVDSGTNSIGRIATSGKVSELPVDANTLTLGGSLAAGPDGNLYATGWDNSGNGVLIRITPTDHVTSIALPANPNALVLGSDGNLWVAADGQIDRVTPAGAVSSFALPSGDGAIEIAQGPDGAMWFTDYGSSAMGRVTSSGSVMEFDPPGFGQYDSINDLTAGPGGQISYTSDTNGPAVSFNPANVLLAGGSAATATAGQSSTVTVASFVDLAPNPNAQFYQARIDWGDGTQSTGTIAPHSSGGFDVSGTHTWTIGTNSVTVTIKDVRPASSDPGGLAGRSAIAYGTVTAPAPPAQGTGVNVSATAGKLFSGVVATYTGVALNSLTSYSATIDWGDGHVSTGTVAADGQGGITVSGSNRYAKSGPYTISTTLWPWQYGGIIPVAGGVGVGHSGPGHVVIAAVVGSMPAQPVPPIPEPPVPLPPIPYPGPNAVTSTATVAPGVMDGAGYSLPASSKQPLNNVVATFTLSQPTSDLSHFHATIIWNDPGTRDWFTLSNPPTTDAPITAGGPGSFSVTANTSFTQFGLYHYQVLISDDRLGS
ncbi:MAG TPA: hypothetical protein VN541_13490, partial [Tepidisphaeraceae bacterium]|nr:hypothetical protein [Tepidisphaeraceae bacterium]